MKHTLFILTTLLLSPLAALHAQSPQDDVATSVFGGETVEVSVRLDTALEVNGASLVPHGLFGVTAFNGPETATDERWRTLLMDSGLRWVGMPAAQDWLLPPEAPAGFAAGWADTPAGAAFLDHRRRGYHIPSCLKAWRDIGVEPMLYLGFQGIFKWPDSGDGKPRPKAMPPLFPVTSRDIERAAVEWAEYVALFKRVDPGLTWIHLENEPNALWFRFGKGGADYAAIFKEVAKRIKSRNPGVKVGGPVLCWPPSFPPPHGGAGSWYTWDGYTMPLIETAGEELDFFDFHLYGGTSPLGMEEVQTVANAMWLKTGRRKPVIISEYGAYLTDDDMRSVERVWEKRVAPWQRQVMDFLEFQPDKVISLQSHDLLAQAGGNFQVFKGLDPEDQFALAKMYRTWAPLKGRRVLASSPHPAVRVFAARNVSSLSGKERLALVLVNSSDQVKNVTVRVEGAPENPPIDPAIPIRGLYIRPAGCAWQVPDAAAPGVAEGIQRTDLGGAVGGTTDGPVAAPADAGPLSAAKRAAAPAADRARVESGSFLSDRPVYAFTLAPRETMSVEYALTKAAPPARTRWTRDVFGDVVHREFEKPGDTVEVSFDLAGIPIGGADTASVRVGLLGSRKGDQVTMTVGDCVCPLSQDWFQSVPLPAVPGTGKVKAVFTMTTRGEPSKEEQERDGAASFKRLLRFGSATLVLEGNGTFAVTDSKPPADDAPVAARWSFDAAQPAASRMLNPWSAATLSPSRDRYLVEKGAAVATRLTAAQDDRGSTCESLLFRVPQSGWYHVNAAGKLAGLSNPTAGSAWVTLFVLGHGNRETKTLTSFPLNTPGGYGSHPQSFEGQDVRWFEAGWRIVLGVQTVNGGPANAGTSTLDVTRFVVEKLSAAKDAP
jgi:hypothetical protein